MSRAVQLAVAVMPCFAKNVLQRRPWTYGCYASHLGRNPAKEAITLGGAFHAIGGACVLHLLPVAPLHYVQRQDGRARGIFEADALEARDVLPYYDEMYVAAREYPFSAEELERVGRTLSKIPSDWSPHRIWHCAIVSCPRNSDRTYFQSALSRYREFTNMEMLTRRGMRHAADAHTEVTLAPLSHQYRTSQIITWNSR